ncbi:tetratricopeptide repeat protein [Acerihabitans arboris]|uniref:Tetratricopeptide repeat protein n=1 Tax=Acerihabitans arboris TaxID=2691583 RepID=A0A845SKX2_9GAMM|nr:tetratricopeptide repeat protein [Acerihabitans arboris]NDL63897.1 tetratricopeptide repeat protein [Acerihabitans arboris]
MPYSIVLLISKKRILPVAVGALLLLSGVAHAMGDSSTTTPTCPKGQIYDSRTKSCMVDKGSKISDTDRTQYAYSLAKAGRYDEALGVLNTLRQPNTAKAWNYRGYATRKLGRTDEGIGYYQKSIALDPHYAQVREYLGEAYMIKGRPDLAREQLATIKTLCGTSCEEYRDLSAAINGHPES